MDVYSRFNRPKSKRNVACDPAEGKTQQEFKDECDINKIMARSIRTGVFPPQVKVGRYGDFSDVSDYQEAQELLTRASGQFSGLPAKVRDRFHNDPARFLAWIEDRRNIDEAHELGLLSEEGAKRKAAREAAAAEKKP